jgi:hypothetical protein
MEPMKVAKRNQKKAQEACSSRQRLWGLWPPRVMELVSV